MEAKRIDLRSYKKKDLEINRMWRPKQGAIKKDSQILSWETRRKAGIEREDDALNLGDVEFPALYRNFKEQCIVGIWGSKIYYSG